MRYNNPLGIKGNMDKIYDLLNGSNNKIFNNKSDADQKHSDSVGGLLDVAEVSSDVMDALAEIGEMLEDIYNALAEIGEMIAEGE